MSKSTFALDGTGTSNAKEIDSLDIVSGVEVSWVLSVPDNTCALNVSISAQLIDYLSGMHIWLRIHELTV